MNVKTKSHTTSTKCQYQADVSNPRWWLVANCPLRWRTKQISSRERPIKTWAPCRPVSIKKQDPNALSEMENWAQAYSDAWRTAKPSPRRRHQRSPWVTSESWPVVIAWWDQVRNAPEESRRRVPRRGAPEGEGMWIPWGGQVRPISGVGTRALVKKAQKNEANSAISLRIKIMNPVIILLCTGFV